jgi:hypothetical protein
MFYFYGGRLLGLVGQMLCLLWAVFLAPLRTKYNWVKLGVPRELIIVLSVVVGFYFYGRRLLELIRKILCLL